MSLEKPRQRQGENLMESRYETQKKMVRQHLLQHGHITPLEALSRYGCLRLAAVVYRLRNDGLNIETVEAERKGHDGRTFRYADYRLVEKTVG